MLILIDREKAIHEIQIVANKMESMGEPESASTFRNTIKILMRMRHERQWIPCDMQLPDEEIPVLVCGEKKGIYVAIRRSGEWWKYSASKKKCSPYAWMPLPEPCQS